MKSDYDTVADALYAMPFDPTTYRVEAAKICVAHGWEYDEFIGQIVQRMSDKIRGISVSSYTNQLCQEDTYSSSMGRSAT